MLTTQVGVSRC